MPFQLRTFCCVTFDRAQKNCAAYKLIIPDVDDLFSEVAWNGAIEGAS